LPAYETTLLDPPYPNPFNPRTTIRYRLSRAARVDLAIFDVAGRRVRVLESDRQRGAGLRTVTWNGRDDRGRVVASGVYFVRLRVDGESYSRRLVLLK
jgi:flagellar hook assembly protein FlgD